MSDTRTIDDFRFGLEWEPKLAEMMLRFPWPDSAFVAGDPTKVCKKCGGGELSSKHVVEMSVSLIRPVEMVEGVHDFEPSPPFSEEKINSARDEWRRRMANLPTPEAEEAWRVVHADRFLRLRELLFKCGVRNRDNIETLGCTGCVHHDLSLDDIKFLRIGLAGSGVGLPCFVSPDRYCLAHETTGGLQDGQGQLYADEVERVARPLTPAEQAHAKLVSAARKSEREHGAHSLLHGHTLPAGWEETETDGVEGGAQVETLADAVDGIREEGGIDDIVAAGKMREPIFAWKCDEHVQIDWACRRCVAQAIVEGELMPVYVFDVDHTTSASGFDGECFGAEVVGKLSDEEEANSNSVKIYVRVATFTRKLARD